MDYIIGIDNGVTGTISILGCDDGGFAQFCKVPCKAPEQDFTRMKKKVVRVDTARLEELLKPYAKYDSVVVMERPMTNPARSAAAQQSSMRCLEAELIVIERLGLPLHYVSSQEWQKAVMPKGTKTSAELKKASADLGCRYFPFLSAEIRKHRDADSLLMAMWWGDTHGSK